MSPNPYGNLAGFTDPSEAGWQMRALQRVQERQAKSTRSSSRKNGMYLFFDDPFRVLLDEACMRRDISLSGYGRRAVGAFIAHDLGIPLTDVLQHVAYPNPYQAAPGNRTGRTSDNGTDHGAWLIEGLRKL